MKLDSPSSLRSSSNSKELQRWYTQERDKAFMEIVLFSQCPLRLKPAHFRSNVFINMFRMVADKLILNWTEKIAFYVDVLVCYQITMWLIFLFSESSLFKMNAEENIIIFVS